jgi:predicted dehydrogenase
MNAGAIPANHWVHDPEVGGGRLLGEACHLIDLAIYLTGSLVAAVSASDIGGASDCASIIMRHVNGSTSVVNYLANGNPDLSKERIEVHSDGRSLLLDNFRELRGFGFRSFNSLKTKQDKGHRRQFALFAERVKIGGPALIPWVEIANSARATLAISVALSERRWVTVSEI